MFASQFRRTLSWLLLLGSACGSAVVAADGPDAQEQVLRGVVKDREGKPVEAAKVWAYAAHFIAGNEAFDSDTTDAEGRFSLTIPARWHEGAEFYQQVLGVLAHREGHAIGALGFHGGGRLPEKPLEIILPETSSAPLKVLAPDNKPLPGAVVKPASLLCDTIYTGLTESQANQIAKQWGIEARRTPWGMVAARLPVALPEALQTALAVRADGQGQATLNGVSHANLNGIVVEAPSFGMQNMNRATLQADDEPPLATIRLLPLAELTGQLVGKPEDVAGKKIRLLAYPGAAAGGKVAGNMQLTVTTDAEGKFRAAVMEGAVFGIPDWDVNSPLRPVLPEQFAVKAGVPNHLEIPLAPAVKVFGYVRDAATGKGIPGIRLGVASWVRNEPLVTDENGRYEILSAPGLAMALPIRDADWIPADKSLTPAQEKISGKEHELKPILLHRAAVLAGTVVDDGGRPVPDAQVLAAWYGYSHALARDDLNSETVKTDSDGKFTLRSVDPTSECRVTAEKEFAFTGAAKIVKGHSPPLTLSISGKHGLVLAGRAVDAAGKPVAGALLELWRQPWRPDFYEAAAERVAIPAGENWKTDDDGNFVAPGLRPDGKYRVTLADPRFETSHTAWIVADGKVPPLDDLLARKLGEHLGAVVSGDSQPIAGATVVFQGGGKRLEGTTNEKGQFKLSPAPDGPGMLFISKVGYRYHGRRLNSFGRPLEVKLAKSSEPYGEKLEIKPPTVSLEKRRELARKLADDLIREIGIDLTGQQRAQVLRQLAMVDSQAALQIIDEKPFLVPLMNDMVRYQAARTLMATSPDDALELVDGLKTGEHMSSMTYAELAGLLPADKQARKLELLGEALVKAQAVKEPGFRLVSIARVAEGLLDAGEKERGTKLLKENASEVKNLNKSGYDAFLRGMFAEELAQVDLEPALALVTEITDYGEKVRHLGNIAHELGGLNPAEAERVLALIPKPPMGSNAIWQRDSDAVKVCYRMAPVDLPRAKRLADASVDPFHKAHARGAMAVAIASRDPAQAATLMRQAFDALDETLRPGYEIPVSAGNAGNVGGWLVWQGQQIDPELGAELLWRLRTVLPEEAGADPQRSWRDIEALGSAAMFLSLIDEESARELLMQLERSANTANSRTYLLAWGMVDPQRAIDQVTAAKGRSGPQRQAVTLIAAIAADGEQRLKTIHYHAGIWRLDVEDIDP